MYHQVGYFAPMRSHRANYCDAGRFRRQMAFLAKGGFSVLSLDQALAGLRGELRLKPRSVVLTFDDGYRNFREHALPVLQAYGFPAVVYAISGWLGRRMAWARHEPGRLEPELLSAAQLRELQSAGVCVGSHGLSHAKLGELDADAQLRELEGSRKALQDLLGSDVRHLCYPFGSFNRATVSLAGEVGYASATTCLRGAATPADHPLVLPRKAISFGDSLAGFAWKVVVKNAPKSELVRWRAVMAEAESAGSPSALDSGETRTECIE
ncbi:polysaccharide deacetylase family protein [Thiohalocapsa marina]